MSERRALGKNHDKFHEISSYSCGECCSKCVSAVMGLGSLNARLETLEHDLLRGLHDGLKSSLL